MYRKYKIKKRHKFNIYYVFGAFAISLMFMSYGYSLWSDTLEIQGTANIKRTEEGGGEEGGGEDVKIPEMAVEIAESSAYVGLASPGLKVVSTVMVNGVLTTTIEKTADSDYQMPNNFSFLFSNTTGYEATDGKAQIKVTGSLDGVGTIAPSVPATASNNVGAQVQFHANIPLNSAKILEDTKIDISIQYLVNGEVQAFRYCVIIKIGTT